MRPATYDWMQLPEGPRLAVATLPHSELASLTIHVPAGSRDEDQLPTGLAHFLEHMAFKGTPTRSARQLSIEIESTGGQLNACTSEDQTTYEGKAEAEQLPLLADILCDMVWRAKLPAEDIPMERDVIGEEIVMYRETPSDHISDLISQALWANHPLGQPISGSLESIARIDQPALLRFRDQHHFRNDLVIAAAGPFSLDEVRRVIESHLPSSFHQPVPFRPFDRNQATVNHLVESRETDQLQLSLAWHTSGRHSEQRHALRLLSLLLGESASSRLFLQLREDRGLCYQISSDTSLYHDTGAFEINAGLDPARRDEAIDLILKEIHDLADKGPNEQELQRAKRLAIAHSKLAFESTSAHAQWAGEGVLDFGHVPSRDEWRDKVLAVTTHDILDVTRECLSTPPCIAEIRPD